MGFVSARKPSLTAITGGIWFTLLLATGIQGKLITKTASKNPGHKPEPILSLLRTCKVPDVGVIILTALCVTFPAGMHAHLVAALPVSSEASSS